jgi:hypothetical protein
LSSKKFTEKFNIPNKTCVFGLDAPFNRKGEGRFFSIRGGWRQSKMSPPGDEESFWMIYKGIFVGDSFSSPEGQPCFL